MVGAVDLLMREREGDKNKLGSTPFPLGAFHASRNGQGIAPLPVHPSSFRRKCRRLLRLVQMRQSLFGMLRGNVGVARLSMLDGFRQMLDTFAQMWIFSATLSMIS